MSLKEYCAYIVEIADDVLTLDFGEDKLTFQGWHVSMDLFENAVKTYQEQYRFSRKAAIKKALKAENWFFPKKSGEVKSFYV